MKKEVFHTYFLGTQDRVHYSMVFSSGVPWKFKKAFGTFTRFYLISAYVNGTLLCPKLRKVKIKFPTLKLFTEGRQRIEDIKKKKILI